MPLAPGDKLGPYEILGPLGGGGMGEVYRAKDTQLDREVAVKVLPYSMASDRERLARFDREAKILAALSHPNIAVIYGLEKFDGGRALIMELVPGDTLGARIKSGAMPVEEALNVATQMAEALEAAHEKGVTHRDLKPGNVMITPTGLVKVLDFGLAAMSSPSASVPGDPENSPTLTMGMTQAGAIMGTASYMSPEQAAGAQVDRRADIWSFGVVLCEMLTGKRLFGGGESISHTLADVLRAPIDFEAIPAGPLRKLLKRCLDRSLKTRLQSIAEARIAIEEMLASQESGVENTALAAHQPTASKLPWAIAAAFAIAAGVGIWSPWRTPLEQASVVFDIFPGKDQSFAPNHPSISPDGRKIALTVLGGGVQSIAVRNLDSGELKMLPGTEGSGFADWSPDSKSLVFSSGSKLRRIEVAGGPPQTLCDYGGNNFGFPPSRAWSATGAVLFNGPAGDLWSVSDQGGMPQQVTTLDATRPDRGHGLPQFLPDGKHFLYFAKSTNEEKSEMAAGSLDEKGKRTSVLQTPRAAFYARDPQGREYLLYPRDGALVAQAFDSGSLKVSGEAFLVLPQVGVNNDHPFMTVSASGALVYTASVGSQLSYQLRWKDRSGKEIGVAGAPGPYGGFSLSPNEQRIALHQRVTRKADVYLMDLTQKGQLTRFTFDPEDDLYPLWTRPDGADVIFRRSGQVFQKPASGTAPEKPLQGIVGNPNDLSRDGQHVLSRTDKSGLFVSTNGKSEPFGKSTGKEGHGQFSPDGKWIVYDYINLDSQVWMQPYPETGAKFQISPVAAFFPRWRADGKELYYVTADNMLNAVTMTLGPSPQWGTPVPLFQMGPPTTTNSAYWPYSVSANGQKFLVMDEVENAGAQPVTVVTNWLAIAKRK